MSDDQQAAREHRLTVEGRIVRCSCGLDWDLCFPTANSPLEWARMTHPEAMRDELRVWERGRGVRDATGCKTHDAVDASCCPVCLIEERDEYRRAAERSVGREWAKVKGAQLEAERDAAEALAGRGVRVPDERKDWAAMDFSTAGDLCEHSGHDWLDAGGGMEICGVCGEERWAETEDATNEKDRAMSDAEMRLDQQQREVEIEDERANDERFAGDVLASEWVCQCGWRSETRPAYALCCSTTHPPAINACMTERPRTIPHRHGRSACTDVCERCGKPLTDQDGLMNADMTVSICDECEDDAQTRGPMAAPKQEVRDGK